MCCVCAVISTLSCRCTLDPAAIHRNLLFGMLINSGKTFADGFKDVLDYVLSIVFGASIAYAVWKKNNQGEKKQ